MMNAPMYEADECHIVIRPFLFFYFPRNMEGYSVQCFTWCSKFQEADTKTPTSEKRVLVAKAPLCKTIEKCPVALAS